MKKLFAILLALCLCLSTALAQEPVKMETVEIDGFIGFAVPAEWEGMEVKTEEAENGMLVLARNPEHTMMFVMNYTLAGMGLTPEMAVQELNADGTYSVLEVVENQHGMKVIRFQFADGSIAGCYVLDQYGLLYAFSYGYLDGTLITPEDAVVNQLVEDTIASVFPSEKEMPQ